MIFIPDSSPQYIYIYHFDCLIRALADVKVTQYYQYFQLENARISKDVLKKPYAYFPRTEISFPRRI